MPMINFQAGSMHHLLEYLSAVMTIMVIMTQEFPKKTIYSAVTEGNHSYPEDPHMLFNIKGQSGTR